MPNRILKDSICTSDTIDQLSAEAEVFFYRLLVQCDDFGRMDARPAILRSRCYPLRVDRVTDQQVGDWLTEIQQADLAWVYVADNKPYLQITTWDIHQQKRAKYSKFPDPHTDVGERGASDSNGYQLPSDASYSPRESRIENRESRIENRESRGEKREARSEEYGAGAPAADAAPPPAPPAQPPENETTETPEAPVTPLYSPQVQRFLDSGGSFPSGRLADGTTKKDSAMRYITQNVADNPESLQFWADIVAAYCRQWSSKSYMTMVNDYYKQGRLPGQSQARASPPGPASGNGSRLSPGLEAARRVAQRQQQESASGNEF